MPTNKDRITTPPYRLLSTLSTHFAHYLKTIKFCLVASTRSFIIATMNDNGQIMFGGHIQLDPEYIPLTLLLVFVAANATRWINT